MKLTTLFLAATLALVKAQSGDSGDAITTLPEEGAGTVNAGPTTGGDETGGTATGGSPENLATSSALMEQPIMPLANKDEFHMKPVRVVHARAQFDQPEVIEGVMVSEYGSIPNDLAAGYIAGLDTVNTASVEGGLMFVQAECINQDSRAPSDRCVRKNKVRYMVFYEIMIAQTNETLAQFPDTGYGPMVPMDGGRCTPVEGETKLPNACYQFSGENGQPNLGPFVGGEDKSIDPRAPYLGTYWFSFPNFCATKKWGEKSEECIKETRAGLCPFGYNPNGVDCTYSYQILGYVPIDDVVGISSFKDKNGKKYGNFSNWCDASEDHIEFAGDDLTGEMKEGLPFWNDPTNTTANANRTVHMLSVYRDILTGDFESMDVEPEALKLFRPLPTPEEMEASNPKCYESIKSCGTGNGCKRYGYSQLCTPCEAGEGCELPTDFVFPTLAKAETSLPPEETDTTKPNTGGGGGGGGGNGGDSSAAISLTSTITAAFVSVAAVAFAL